MFVCVCVFLQMIHLNVFVTNILGSFPIQWKYTFDFKSQTPTRSKQFIKSPYEYSKVIEEETETEVLTDYNHYF